MLEARLIGGIGDWFSQRVVKIRRNLSPEDWTHVSLLFSSFFFVVGEPIEESRLDRARRTTEGRKNELTFLLGNGTASSFYFFLFYFFVHLVGSPGCFNRRGRVTDERKTSLESKSIVHRQYDASLTCCQECSFSCNIHWISSRVLLPDVNASRVFGIRGIHSSYNVNSFRREIRFESMKSLCLAGTMLIGLEPYNYWNILLNNIARIFV